ncbi:MAG: SpoIID/LytB domain-containing protein [Candidatus Omnitrophota bacterium]
MKPRLKVTVILACLALLFCFCKTAFTLSVQVPDKIRVAIVDKAGQIDIAIKGPYKITTIQTNEVLKQGKVLWQGKITPINAGIKLNTYKDEEFKVYGVNIIPAKSPSLYINKNLYRGTLQIVKTKDGLLSAINMLGIEDYIKGVLYHEISNKWPMEAIKAQAVTSRTFAIYQAQQNAGNDYYLNADVKSQVYRGVFAEKYRTDKAVDQTKGEILICGNKILPAFFHSTCGGSTENVSNLWKVSSKALKGIRCSFCGNAPLFNWKAAIPLTEIADKISKTKGRISQIQTINILSRNRSGRVSNVKIIADKNIVISAKDLREILSPRIIRSTNFVVTIIGDAAVFHGRGWGHGVGMCQWGTFAMAKKGYDYKQILEYYYPKAEVVELTIDH